MKRFSLLLILALTLFSCKHREKINELVNSIKTLPVTKDIDVISGEEKPTIETIDGVKYKCVSTPKTISQSIDDIVAFNPNTGVLFPGSVVKGSSLKNGILNPVSVARNGGKLTISYITFAGSVNKEVNYTEKVENASFQNIQNAEKKLLSQLPDGNQLSIISFEKTEAHELNESFLRLGLSVNWLSGSVKSQLTQSFQSNKSKYFVKVIQRYYDMSFETNFSKSQEPADFFSSDVNAAQISSAIGDTIGNPPAYVKSISYGRMLLLFIESDASQKDLTAGLEATFSSGTTKGQTSITAGQKTAIENSKINLLSLGGSAPATVKLLSGNKLDSLVTYLQAGANFSKNSPGYPITYTTRYLKNNEAAKLSYTTNYAVKDCQKNPRAVQTFYVNFIGITDDKDDDEPIDFTVKKGNQIIGQLLNVGAGVTWDDGTNIQVAIPITVASDELDRKQIVLEIDKSNAHGGGNGQGGGFSFSRHTVDVKLEDGSIENWFQYNQGFRLGNGDSKFEKIPF